MPDPIVATAAGKLRGSAQRSVLAFLGVPYAQAARFRPPRPVAPWPAVRDALDFGPWAYQTPELGIGGNRLPYNPARVLPMSEDCLTLNLWTPALRDGRRRPVLVWLHGGRFSRGTVNVPELQGAWLARQHDVVVLTVNHRLGLFGFLHAADLPGGPEFQGNCGMLDLVAALQWVRENIAQFGGDPANVMLFGESGGGARVSTLLGMPSAEGLFHRAAIQSGPRLRGLTRAAATANADALLRTLGLTPRTLGELFRLPPEQLIAAQGRVAEFGPVTDGQVLPAHPFVPHAVPTSAAVPLLIGTNKDEMNFRLRSADAPHSLAAVRSQLLAALARVNVVPEQDLPADRVDALLETYRQLHPAATPPELFAAVTTDNLRAGSVALAERRLALSATPLFMYQFNWETRAHGGLYGAMHGLEIPFVFGTVEASSWVGEGAGQRLLSSRMSGAWAEFARSGQPRAPGLPAWPVYTVGDRQTMLFDAACSVGPDPLLERLPLWEGLV